ncbi:hypothetical protein ACQPZP_09870 [Spirillospora sp. CA-142024]|uniref:hypothetical protein n=1 Tax=Spirillospora sp. CA-142024 TaxID=3240036 RepID=UPI003D8DD7E8
MFSKKSFYAGILTPFVLVMAAVISAANGEWLLFTCFSTATAVTVSIVVKQWPHLRYVMWGAVAIVCVMVIVCMASEAPWLLGTLVVICGIGFISANNKRPGKESLRIPRR